MLPVYGQPMGADDDVLDLHAQLKAGREIQAAVAQRRRVVGAWEMMQGGQGPQGAKQREQHAFSWDEHVRRLTEPEFKLRYRLDFDAFKELLGVIGKDLEVSNPQKAVAGKGYTHYQYAVSK